MYIRVLFYVTKLASRPGALCGGLISTMRPADLDPKHTTSSVKHGGGSVMAWACMAWQKTVAATYILKSLGTFSLLTFSHIQQSWLDGASAQMTNDSKTYCESNPGFFQGREV